MIQVSTKNRPAPQLCLFIPGKYISIAGDKINIGYTFDDVVGLWGLPKEKVTTNQWHTWYYRDKGITIDFRKGQVGCINTFKEGPGYDRLRYPFRDRTKVRKVFGYPDFIINLPNNDVDHYNRGVYFSYNDDGNVFNINVFDTKVFD
jgi:hypothetical protein